MFLFLLRYPEDQEATYLFDARFFYELATEVYDIIAYGHLSVGVRLPGGEFQRPITRPQLFWVLPGEAKLWLY